MIQRWSCAVLIVNLRSEMHDMTLNFKRDLSVSYRVKLCIWKEIKEDALYDCPKNTPNSPSVQGSNGPVYILPLLWRHRLNHKMID